MFAGGVTTLLDDPHAHTTVRHLQPDCPSVLATVQRILRSTTALLERYEADKEDLLQVSAVISMPLSYNLLPPHTANLTADPASMARVEVAQPQHAAVKHEGNPFVPATLEPTATALQQVATPTAKVHRLPVAMPAVASRATTPTVKVHASVQPTAMASAQGQGRPPDALASWVTTPAAPKVHSSEPLPTVASPVTTPTAQAAMLGCQLTAPSLPRLGAAMACPRHIPSHAATNIPIIMPLAPSPAAAPSAPTMPGPTTSATAKSVHPGSKAHMPKPPLVTAQPSVQPLGVTPSMVRTATPTPQRPVNHRFQRTSLTAPGPAP